MTTREVRIFSVRYMGICPGRLGLERQWEGCRGSRHAGRGMSQ